MAHGSFSENASDAELVEHLRNGRQDALRILYGRYSNLVYTIAFKMLNSASEAEDLTQDVFLNFWKQEKFDPNRAALSTYLCVITRSRALNRLRQRGSQQRSLEKLQALPPREFTASTPLESASLAEQQQTLKRVLAELPDRQRQILEMNFYQGVSQSNIAQQLDLPLGTVKTNARQGLISLRQRLGSAVEWVK
ncbi:MAG: sigma-70 family RNA polymerase sigma factor [Leptolyngbya sp. RL_3_1]|nr:sigma-70 family RNA polymerase sigma factor [Leptolyngbya sp. RL_3_1]